MPNIVQLPEVVDVTSTEALLVRKNADGGDVLTVDTTNSKVVVGGTGRSTFNEAVIVNESGADSDSRIEGDTDVNLIYADAGADKVGIGNAAPDEKLHVTGNIKLSGELMGSKMLLQQDRTSITADAYMGSAALAYGATWGFVMPRAGSVVGLSGCAHVTAETTPGTIIVSVLKNNASVWSLTLTTSGTGDYKGQATQARGTDVFAAGDLITAYIDFGTFVGTVAPMITLIEVTLDT